MKEEAGGARPKVFLDGGRTRKRPEAVRLFDNGIGNEEESLLYGIESRKTGACLSSVKGAGGFSERVTVR